MRNQAKKTTSDSYHGNGKDKPEHTALVHPDNSPCIPVTTVLGSCNQRQSVKSHAMERQQSLLDDERLVTFVSSSFDDQVAHEAALHSQATVIDQLRDFGLTDYQLQDLYAGQGLSGMARLLREHDPYSRAHSTLLQEDLTSSPSGYTWYRPPSDYARSCTVGESPGETFAQPNNNGDYEFAWSKPAGLGSSGKPGSEAGQEGHQIQREEENHLFQV